VLHAHKRIAFGIQHDTDTFTAVEKLRSQLSTDS
jgi:hypothetical protein